MKHWQLMICLAAFTYQLGACPCGCLKENYWYQALAPTHSNPSAHADERSRLRCDQYSHDDQAVNLSLDSEHQHHCTELIFVRGSIQRQLVSQTLTFPSCEYPNFHSCVAAQDDFPVAKSFVDRLESRSALPLRALTSVYLL